MQKQTRSAPTQPGPDADRIRQALDRARWELAAMAGRIRTLETQLVEARESAEAMRKERDREQRRADRLRGSESYRLGYGLVSLVKDPVHAAPRLARAVLRRLRGLRAAAPAVAVRAQVAAQRLPAHLYVLIGLDAGAVREFV